MDEDYHFLRITVNSGGMDADDSCSETIIKLGEIGNSTLKTEGRVFAGGELTVVDPKMVRIDSFTHIRRHHSVGR